VSTLKLGEHFLTRPQILKRRGTDLVNFTFMGPTPFPKMKYQGTVTVEVEKGHGEQWLKDCFGIEDAEVITVGGLVK